jgi:Gene product 88
MLNLSKRNPSTTPRQTSMLIKEAKAVIGSLGKPSKMPGTSYGISAHACLTGAKLAQIEGSTCHNCYALKGNYIYRDVKKSHANRMAGLMHPMWVSAMVRMLKNKHKSGKLPPFHRWHDSGDIQSEQHLARICEVAAQTPEVSHWLPTREIGILSRFIEAGGVVPANLTIRVSATMIDGKATKTWATTSTVHDKSAAFGHVCPAQTQGNKCGECRACWSRNVANVSYHIH